jgi:hypothetical protein
MNLDSLMKWIMGVVIAYAAIGKLDVLQRWIWISEAKVLYASRTSTWGSPDIFQTHKKHLTDREHSVLSRPRK